MSQRVYLSIDMAVTPAQEDTPVSRSIPVSAATVKAVPTRLPPADLKDDGRWVRRRTVVIDLLVPHVPVEVLPARWGLRLSCLSPWRPAVLLRGLDRLVSHPSGGRRPPWPPPQNKRLVERLEAGPQVVGCATACGTSVLLRVLSWREVGVLSNGPYGWTWLHTVGFALPKARVVSAQRAAARRPAGRQEAWPRSLRAATRRKGLILLEEEARCAPWGACSDPWARRGQQPAVTTRGNRHGDQVLGAMESCSGRLCSQGSEGGCAADRDPAFVRTRLAHTTEPRWLIPAGGREHTSQATTPCLAQHAERLTVPPWPS